MTGEVTVVFGTAKTLQAAGTGAAIANNTVSAAATNPYNVTTDGLGFMEADLEMSIIFATAPAAGSMIDVYAQELLVDGTNNAQVPTATYLQKYVGTFPLNAVTTTQYLKMRGYQVPNNAKYYLYNNGTGQSSGVWGLIITPRTYKPA